MTYPEVEFVKFIVKSLVDDTDGFTIDRTMDERGVLINLSFTNANDAARVIGKRGSTVMSIRQMLRALGTLNKAHYSLVINEGRRA